MYSTLAPLPWHLIEGVLGHAVDMVPTLAIAPGVTTTIIFGSEQLHVSIAVLTGISRSGCATPQHALRPGLD
jgi:choline-glycine betaine transporter